MGPPQAARAQSPTIPRAVHSSPVSLQPGRLVAPVIHDLAGIKKLDELLVQGAHLQTGKPPILIDGGGQRPALYFPQRADQATSPMLAL